MRGASRLVNDTTKEVADRGGLAIVMTDPRLPTILCCYQSLFVAIEIVEPGTPTAFPDFVDAVEMAGGIWIAASNAEDAMCALDELGEQEKLEPVLAYQTRRRKYDATNSKNTTKA